jgi:hypothetical protein
MAKQLTAKALDQLTRVDIAKAISFTIGGVERKTDLVSYSVSFDREFGVSTLEAELLNQSGEYSQGGSKAIELGDEVILTQMFAGATDRFVTFRGFVRQRGIGKSSGTNSMTLTCMDYIVKLQETDLDELFEATKVTISDETLTPTFLPSPNQMFASIFNFANNNVASFPPPSIVIKSRDNLFEDPQFGGFEINHETGQVVLGALLNALDNYDVIATYSFYPTGLYLEDVIEDIIKAQDGYGKFLFDNETAADVVSNNLTETFNNIEGLAQDTMTPNYVNTEIEIRTTNVSAISEGDTSFVCADASGLPTSGTATLNGDTFTWSGKSSNTLTGIPATGSNSLLDHPASGSLVFTTSYAPGRLWFTTYNNVTSSLSSGDFTIGGGGSFSYFDPRFGRLIVDTQLDLDETVTCDTDYSFKTLQASGIEINKQNISERKIRTRFDAINEIRKFAPSNYLIRTKGQNKIWATYIKQKINADHEVLASKAIDYAEDQDLYTRTLFFGKNANPHNIMFDNGVTFVDTGETYTAIANNSELTYSGDIDHDRIYKTGLSAGKIDITNLVPTVFVDGIAIDNQVHEILNSQVTTERRVKTVTETTRRGRRTDVQVNQFFYYKVFLGHTSIAPSEVVTLYSATGGTLFTLGPNDGNIDYENGIWNVPGDKQNTSVDQVSSADYWILFATDKLKIDHDAIEFRISKDLVPEPGQQVVTATFEYFTVVNTIYNAGNAFDGRYDTQVQSTFYAKPPSGFVYAIIDLGSEQVIQAVDIIGGYFKPDNDSRRKIDYTNAYTIKWSFDAVNFFDIAAETNNFTLSGGDTKSFDENILGENFRARYFKLIIEDVEKIEYNPDNRPSGGVWIVAFTEIMVFGDVVLRGEGKLIPTTELSSNVAADDPTVPVLDTSSFTSGAGLAYIDRDQFWYSGKTPTTFTGCTGVGTHSKTIKVHSALEDDSSFLDKTYLLPKIGDVIFKDTKINNFLDTQEKADARAKDFLTEFVKDHTKGSIEMAYAPHVDVGHTVHLNDPTNRTDQNYFVEAVTHSDDGTSLTIAYYP